MGSALTERNRDNDEGPVHEVTIKKKFAMSIYETTWRQWSMCVEAGGCRAPIALDGPPDAGWGMGQRPVINVSSTDAEDYVSWLRQRTGKNYSLPSEAEWEYAARAGSRSAYYSGEQVELLCTIANGADLATDFNDRNDLCFDGFGRETAPVGSFKANDFGLFDMHGNVWEWTSDCWSSNYLGAVGDQTARKDGDCGQRSLRGGSWGSYPNNLRSATRYAIDYRYRGHEVGIRVVQRLQE